MELVRVFVLKFSLSFFGDRQSLKIENESNSMTTSMQKFDHRRLIYGIKGTQERV